MTRKNLFKAARRRATPLLAAGALLLFGGGTAQAGIVYDFEVLVGGAPTGVTVGSLDLPSLTGSSDFPLDFSYTILGFSFDLGDVFGASWAIDPTSGDFFNLSLGAQIPDIFPGSSVPIFSTLFLDQNGATNTFSDSTVTTIFQTDTQQHRLVLRDDGGLLELPTGDEEEEETLTVPVPTTLSLLGAGLIAIAARRRRRN